MNSTELLDIPSDLAARARAVPGLSLRLVQFIHLEIAQYEVRKKRFRPETLALVQRARENAEKMKAEGFDREKAFAELEESLLTLIAERDS